LKFKIISYFVDNFVKFEIISTFIIAKILINLLLNRMRFNSFFFKLNFENLEFLEFYFYIKTIMFK